MEIPCHLPMECLKEERYCIENLNSLKMKKHLLLFTIVSLLFIPKGNAQYCIPTGDSLSAVTEVRIGELYHLVDEPFNVVDTVPSDLLHYYDRTSVVGTMHRNRTTQIEVYTILGLPAPTIHRVALYIDWNQDQDFSDVGEEIAYINNDHPQFTIEVDVNDTIPIGNYRLRIRYNKLANDFPDACSNVDSTSQTLDYTLNIQDWTYPDPPIGMGSPCNNIDFEDGTYNAWDITTGFHPEAYNYWPDPTEIGCCPNTCIIDFGLNAPLGNNDGQWATFCGVYDYFISRHTMVTPGLDPTTNIISRVPPWGGSFSMRLGNGERGGIADVLTKTFLVLPGQTDFSYSYAVVMNEPGHAKKDQPFFLAALYDGNGRLIPNSRQYVISDPGNPDLINMGGTYYKDWTQVVVNLENYIGEDVTLQITVTACAQGAHYGYAYIDADCGSTTLDVSSNQVYNDFKIYPNPSNGTFTIEAAGFSNTTRLRVLDLSGKQVYESKLKGVNQAKLDLTFLTKGIYFVEVSDANKKAVQKLVVK